MDGPLVNPAPHGLCTARAQRHDPPTPEVSGATPHDPSPGPRSGSGVAFGLWCIVAPLGALLATLWLLFSA
jgi:hypothetical protein